MRTSYNAFFVVTFKPWDERTSRAEQFQAIKARLNQQLSKLPAGIAFAFSPPAIPGVGTAGGFTFILEDRSGGDIQFLSKNLSTFMEAARKRPEIASLSTTFLPSVPQEFVDVDRDKVLKQGVNLNDVYRTIQAFMGGYFINYFNRFGRQWQVYIEAESEDRARAENVGQFYVRNNKGENVPLSTLTTVKPRLGPEFTMRFNEFRSAQINGSAAPGYSADQATAALEEVFKETMPREMGFDYSGISFLEQKAREGVPASAIFALSLLFVFLILAALYESWSLPFSVLLSTPVAIFGAFFRLMAAPRHSAGDLAPVHGADRERCLFPDRVGYADRPGGQERNSDRGVCQGSVRAGQAFGGCRSRRRKASAAADPDDLLRVYSRLRPPMDCNRRRIGGAADYGNHTVDRGDDGSQRRGNFLYPGNFFIWVGEMKSGAGEGSLPAVHCRPRRFQCREIGTTPRREA